MFLVCACGGRLFVLLCFSLGAELALLPVWSMLSHAPMYSQVQTLSCPFSSVEALVEPPAVVRPLVALSGCKIVAGNYGPI